MKTVKVGNVTVGEGCPLAIIAGPCVIENEDTVLEIAGCLRNMAFKLKFPLIFKASFDKANRTSLGSFRGLVYEAVQAKMRLRI